MARTKAQPQSFNPKLFNEMFNASEQAANTANPYADLHIPSLLPTAILSWLKTRSLHGKNTKLHYRTPQNKFCLCLDWILEHKDDLTHTHKGIQRKTALPAWITPSSSTTQAFTHHNRPALLLTTFPLLPNASESIISNVHAVLSNDINSALPKHPLFPTEPRLALYTYRSEAPHHPLAIELWNLRNLPFQAPDQHPYHTTIRENATIFTKFA
jgi:hypothetical protein